MGVLASNPRGHGRLSGRDGGGSGGLGRVGPGAGFGGWGRATDCLAVSQEGGTDGQRRGAALKNSADVSRALGRGAFRSARLTSVVWGLLPSSQTPPMCEFMPEISVDRLWASG